MSTLYHLFPPTIHPMVIHFTIAIIYLTTLAGLIGLFVKKDGFYPKVFFLLLTLSIVATLAAGVAGVISEYYVSVSGTVANMLETHKNYGEFTGVLLVFAWGLQWLAQRKGARVSTAALGLCVAATVLVSITGFLGGSMVYDHGLGVLHTSHA